ncbi:MAG: ribonuclease HII [Alphaproteobacteria bacterium]|nr:ribonuclease HII [Alphaproteobacteria bacterium]
MSENYICGIDEAGRGPLAGPVFSACVYIPENKKNLDFWRAVTDSKKLSAAKREKLFPLIVEHAHFGIAQCANEEIDHINILQATLLSMKRAYEQMIDRFKNEPVKAMIDGNKCPALPIACEAVVGGDASVLEIGAASILAKVSRDRFMAHIHEEYPMYGWVKNAGYGTKDHLAAIEAYGPSPYHRLSFAPLKQQNLFAA